MMKRLIAILSTLILAGCATLPTDLEIQQGPELVPPQQQEFSYYSPSSPTEGASPQEIVSGFLAAGTGPQNDYAVAREFLTENFAPRWQPDTQTLIRSGIPIFQSAGESLQIVDINVGAKVDDQGIYQDLDPQETSLRFQLVQEDGEWRISSAPNLTGVTLPVFSVVFTAYPIYFLNTQSSQLIPDLRWFPTRTSTPTRLVNAVLAGPSGWLNELAISAIPKGTALTVNAVRIEESTALVDFDANALEADSRQRRLMLSQLRATLLQLAGVADVEISVNNSTQDIEPAPLPTPSTAGATFALTPNGVSRLSGSEAGVLSGISEFVREAAPTMFAASGDGDNFAFASEEGVNWLVADGLGSSALALEDAPEPTAMFFDSFGYLWLLTSDQQSIRVFDSAGGYRELEYQGESLRAGAISPEGARLAVASGSEQQTIVQVLGVIRDSTGRPVRLTQGLGFTPVLGEALAVSWNGATSLRVLEGTASGLTALSEYPLTGPRGQLNMPPVIGAKLQNGTTLISSYLLSDSSEVWVLSGNSWRRIQVGVLDISTGR
jgi:hypothetical protein